MEWNFDAIAKYAKENECNEVWKESIREWVVLVFLPICRDLSAYYY